MPSSSCTCSLGTHTSHQSPTSEKGPSSWLEHRTLHQSQEEAAALRDQGLSPGGWGKGSWAGTVSCLQPPSSVGLCDNLRGWLNGQVEGGSKGGGNLPSQSPRGPVQARGGLGLPG